MLLAKLVFVEIREIARLCASSRHRARMRHPLQSSTLLVASAASLLAPPFVRHTPCHCLATDDRASPGRLQQQRSGRAAAPPVELDDAPAPYTEVLRLLREADVSNRWPPTSRARAKVIRVKDPTTQGSFSLRRTEGTGSRGTRGNLEFPELARAVFELEKELAPERTPSTMAAINRRTLFLPHMAPGSGVEGSTSLIVGLGEYSGGATVVDGEAHDIRYSPLAFDGWTQTHHTAPFVGERFSVVWFTPSEALGKPYGATLDPRYMSGKVRFSIPGFDDGE